MPDDAQSEPRLGDDASIPGDDAVLRRLSDGGPSMVTIDAVTGVRRPSSGAFKPDEDGVSVFRTSRLADQNLNASAVVTGPHALVVQLSIGEIRSVAQLGVRDDPWPEDVEDPDHPRYAAHALIVGWSGLSKNQRRARQQALATLPSLRFMHP